MRNLLYPASSAGKGDTRFLWNNGTLSWNYTVSFQKTVILTNEDGSGDLWSLLSSWKFLQKFFLTNICFHNLNMLTGGSLFHGIFHPVASNVQYTIHILWRSKCWMSAIFDDQLMASWCSSSSNPVLLHATLGSWQVHWNVKAVDLFCSLQANSWNSWKNFTKLWEDTLDSLQLTHGDYL